MTCQAAPPVWGHALLEELRDFLQARVYKGSYVPQYQDGIFKMPELGANSGVSR